MPYYILAVKRAKRGQTTLVKAIKGISDVHGVFCFTENPTSFARVAIEDSVLDEVKGRIGELCHIEPDIEYDIASNG